MKKNKLTWLNYWMIGYYATIVTTYAAGLSYWQWYSHKYNVCRGAANYCTSMIEPDGPMGLVLFVLIPLAVTLSFVFIGAGIWIIKNHRAKNQVKP